MTFETLVFHYDVMSDSENKRGYHWHCDGKKVVLKFVSSYGVDTVIMK